MDKPEKWIAELLGKIYRMKIKAMYPPNAITPEDRMAALFAVQQDLNHLMCGQEIGLQTTPAGPEQGKVPPKRNDAGGDVGQIDNPIANHKLADLCGLDPDTVSIQMRKALKAAGKAVRKGGVGKPRDWTHDELRAACAHLPKAKLQKCLISAGFGKPNETRF